MLQHPLWFALFLGVPINRSRDQPAPSISFFPLCIARVCWRHSLETPPICLPKHRSMFFFSQWTRQKWWPGGTSVPSLLAQEDVTILKWSGNIRGAERAGKGVCHHNTGGPCLQHSQGWLELAHLKASWTGRCHPAFGLTTVATAILFPSAWSSLPEGLSEGWGLNKYLHLSQVGRKTKLIITTVYKCVQLRV